MPVQRACALLASGCTDTPEEVLGALNIGRRDAELLKLRESLFGLEMMGVVNCPRCCESLELTFLTTEMHSVQPPEEQLETLSLSAEGYEIEFRLPTSQDAIQAAGEKDPLAASYAILRRCLVSIKRGGQAVPPEDLPFEVADAVVHRMEEIDALADVRLSIACPNCAHQWQSTFDIVSFLWGEIDAWARRMLSDVHVLASAYGWNERDIVTLSPVRRQFYLQAVGG